MTIHDAVADRTIMANSRPSWLRVDINGLRAIAVTLVVAFHAGIPGFDGGFIGVDVFFVISGFLITKNLIRDADRGRVRVLQFWGKRIRRLVPALATVVATTTVVGAIVLSPLEMRTFATSALSSVSYVSNFLFAHQATDYFAHDLNTNPFLHTWSLSVEEQFYLVWPFIAVLAIIVARRTGHVRAVLAVLFSLTFVISFTISLVLTEEASSWAFYTIPARAWEFALAGLLALVPMPAGFGSRWYAGVGWWAGLGMLLVSTLTFSASTPFPGTAALIPVSATILLIVCGSHVQGEPLPRQVQFLNVRPIQWIGTTSYSWYLWHWPFIVFAVVVLHTQDVWIRSMAAVLALGAAAATFYFVETPARFSPILSVRLWRTYAFAAVSIALVAALGGGAIALGQMRAASEPIASVLAAAAQEPGQNCTTSEKTPNGAEWCVMGSPDADVTVVLVGDSHAGHWKNSFSTLGAADGYRVLVRWKSNCPAIGTTVVNVSYVADRTCAPYQSETLTSIDQLNPDAVILAGANGYLGRIRSDTGAILGEDQQVAVWSLHFENFLSRLTGSDHAVGVILDNPRMPENPALCLTRAGGTGQTCRASSDAALGELQQIRQVESTISQALKVPTWDPADALCDDQFCDVTEGGMLVYADASHLTNEWTHSRVNDLRNLVQEILAEKRN